MEKHFSSFTCTNIADLNTELQNVFKKFGETIDAYVHRVKEIINKRVVAFVVIDVKDMIIYTVNGLPSTYNVFKTSLRTRFQSLSFMSYIF